MAKLKQSEKRLLVTLGSMLVLLLNAFGINWYLKEQKRIKGNELAYRTKISEYRNLLQELPKNEQRRDWMARERPVFTSIEREAPRLQGLIKQFAGRYPDLSVDQKPLPLKEEENFLRLSVDVDASGDFFGIFGLLRDLQLDEPGGKKSFREVGTVQITADKNDPNLLKMRAIVSQLFSIGETDFLIEEEESSAEGKSESENIEIPTPVDVTILPDSQTNSGA